MVGLVFYVLFGGKGSLIFHIKKLFGINCYKIDVFTINEEAMRHCCLLLYKKNTGQIAPPRSQQLCEYLLRLRLVDKLCE